MAESKPATSTMDVKKIDADTHAVKVICLGDSAVGKSKLANTDFINSRCLFNGVKAYNHFLPFIHLENDLSNFM